MGMIFLGGWRGVYFLYRCVFYQKTNHLVVHHGIHYFVHAVVLLHLLVKLLHIHFVLLSED